MSVYLITERSDFTEDLQFIFEDYEKAKEYVHDEIEKFKTFVEKYQAVDFEPDYEDILVRFEEPYLNSKYVGTLFIRSKSWELDTPIATIEVSKHSLMSFENGNLRHVKPTDRRRSRDYISYDRRFGDE